MTNENANFFCVLGLPKTGTTWLAEYLRSHPQAFIPAIKELQVFSRRFRKDLYDWLDQLMLRNLANSQAKASELPPQTKQRLELLEMQADIAYMPHIENLDVMIDEYRSVFRKRVTNKHAVFGELSTTYCVLPKKGLEALDSVFPQTKYVIIVRDPVERYWSHLKHQAKVKKNIDPVQYHNRYSNDTELLEISDYRTIVEKIQGVIPPDRLHIALYENLFLEKDHSALKNITDFLGLSFIPADLGKVVYAGQSVTMPDDLRLEATQRYNDSYLFGAELFGETPKGWCRYT